MTPVVEIGWNVGAAIPEALAAAWLVRGTGPLRRRESWVVFAWICVMAIALPVAGEGFATLRLWAWGIFVHLPALLAAFTIALRRTAPRSAVACALLAVGIVAFAVDAFFFEPKRLEVTHIGLVSAKLRHPLRIALIADIQTDDVGEFERRAVRAAMAEKPDVILLAGDYVQVADDAKRRTQHEKLRKIFLEESLAAPQGVFAVEGDNDSADWLDIYQGLPVSTSTDSVEYEEGEFRLVALSLGDSRNPGLKLKDSPKFTIALGHAPDFSLGPAPADLLVAGHTHGGQVQIPGYGPPITLSRVPRDWAAGGPHPLPGGRTLVVSRGIGMERAGAPRLRFQCAPQVVIIDVTPGAP